MERNSLIYPATDMVNLYVGYGHLCTSAQLGPRSSQLEIPAPRVPLLRMIVQEGIASRGLPIDTAVNCRHVPWPLVWG